MVINRNKIGIQVAPFILNLITRRKSVVLFKTWFLYPQKKCSRHLLNKRMCKLQSHHEIKHKKCFPPGWKQTPAYMNIIQEWILHYSVTVLTTSPSQRQPAKHCRLPRHVKCMGEWLYRSAHSYLSARYGVSVEECVLALIEEIQDKIKASSISFSPRSSYKTPRLYHNLKQVGDSLFVQMNHTDHNEIPNKAEPNIVQMKGTCQRAMQVKLSLCIINVTT
jgi:hypothetical protein